MKASSKIHKRNLKEAEELISSLQKRLWSADDILREMRMSLYYVNKYLDTMSCEIDGLYYHDPDGSHLQVNQSELFDVLYNKIRTGMLIRGRDVVNKPLKKLTEYNKW